MEDKQLSLTWNSHGSTYKEMFEAFRQKNLLTDITLACDGHKFSVHKLVLASCSQYFETLLSSLPDNNYTIVCMKDVPAFEMHTLLDFMYTGEANFPQSQMNSLLKTAEELKIKGLGIQPKIDTDENLTPCFEGQIGMKQEHTYMTSNSFLHKFGAQNITSSLPSERYPSTHINSEKQSLKRSFSDEKSSLPPGANTHSALDYNKISPKKRRSELCQNDYQRSSSHQVNYSSRTQAANLPLNQHLDQKFLPAQPYVKVEPQSPGLPYVPDEVSNSSSEKVLCKGRDESSKRQDNSGYENVQKSAKDALSALLDMEVGNSPLRDCWDLSRPGTFSPMVLGEDNTQTSSRPQTNSNISCDNTDLEREGHSIKDTVHDSNEIQEFIQASHSLARDPNVPKAICTVRENSSTNTFADKGAHPPAPASGISYPKYDQKHVSGNFTRQEGIHAGNHHPLGGFRQDDVSAHNSSKFRQTNPISNGQISHFKTEDRSSTHTPNSRADSNTHSSGLGHNNSTNSLSSSSGWYTNTPSRTLTNGNSKDNNSGGSVSSDGAKVGSDVNVAPAEDSLASSAFEDDAQFYLDAFTRSAGLSVATTKPLSEETEKKDNSLLQEAPVTGSVPVPPVAEIEDMENRPHICPICRKSFGKAAILKRHHLAHFRPYNCNVCNRSFTRREVLAEHLQEHNGTDMRLPCPVCAMTIKRKRNLQAHIKVKHPEYYKQKIDSKQTLF